MFHQILFFAPNLNQQEKTIVSTISLSWWDNAQLQPRFFQSKKKRFDPAHQLKKEQTIEPATP